MLPNFVIAGVNKAGTTSVFSYLAHHPDVCPSSIKEACYFLPIRYQEQIDNMAAYERLFAHYTHQKIIMEATPGYFYGGGTLAARMQETLGDVSVLIILREPVDRLLSFFRSMKSRLLIPEDMSLKAYVDVCKKQTPPMLSQRENNPYFGLEGGCYSRYLPGWQNIFGDKLKVVSFDALRQDAKTLLQEIARFLAIDELYFENVEFDIENKTIGYKNRFLHAGALKLNRSMETALRKAPHIKNVLRNIYYQLNGRDASRVIDSETVASLHSYYRVYNDQLRSMLAGHGAAPLLPWLTMVH